MCPKSMGYLLGEGEQVALWRVKQNQMGGSGYLLPIQSIMTLN